MFKPKPRKQEVSAPEAANEAAVADAEGTKNSIAAQQNDWDRARTRTLLQREKELKETYKKRMGKAVLLLVLGCLMVGLFVYVAISFAGVNRIGSIVGVAYGFGFIAFGIHIMSEAREITVELRNSEDERDLIEFKQQPVEVRAYKLFRVNQLEVKRHYSQTLSQGAVIFTVGIFCIFSGFVIIFITLKLLSSAQGVSVTTKLIIGGVGAIGAILTNFIAYIYLSMYKATSGRLVTQQNRLVATHFLHFGNYLAARISNDEGLRNSTLSHMAKALARGEGGGQELSGNSEAIPIDIDLSVNRGESDPKELPS